MDPPYGIKFASNFQPKIGERDVKDREQDLTREPEMVKAYRDTWHLGVHSYLAYLRDRLAVAKELLSDTGSIFVQIGEENLHRVRCVMDDILGETNFCAVIPFVKTGGVKQSLLAERCDFLLWYARDLEHVKYRQLYQEKTTETATTFTWFELPDGCRRGLRAAEKHDPLLVPPDARLYRAANITTQGNPVFAFQYRNEEYARAWKTTPAGLGKLAIADRLHVATNSLSYVQYLDDFPVSEITRLWTDTFLGSFAEEKVYVVQTSRKTIERCLLMTTDPGDLVFDPTCGSGTTAYVAEQWGRRWITIDTSRVSIAIARQRLLTAKYDYYQTRPLTAEDQARNQNGTWLTDPTEQIQGPVTFKCKTVPHVTLKSIAQNTNLDPIFAKHEPILEEKLAACNAALARVPEATRRSSP